MKIIKLYLCHLRNAEHFQFLIRFRDLILLFDPALLKITPLFTRFLTLFAVEDECFIVVKKSSFSKEIMEMDIRRDKTFRGLVNLVNAALNHFDADVVAAGKRLIILFDTLGNLAKKPQIEETAGIHNLLQKLEGEFANDVLTIGAADWVAELKSNNEEYSVLINKRDNERGERPDGNMQKTRKEIDKVYNDITKAIETFAKLSDDETEANMYKEFIGRFNVVVENYKNGIAQRKGMSASRRKKKSLADTAVETEVAPEAGTEVVYINDITALNQVE